MIACTLNKATPVIIGDLLISSDYKPSKFELPVLNDDVMQYLSANASDHPIRLDQKIYILKENVCIAFAGTVSDIKSFLEDISIFCNAKEDISSIDIRDFLQQHVDSEAWKEISFVLLVVDPQTNHFNLCKILHGQWLRADTTIFGEAWATGSGGEDFLVEASENVELFSTYESNNAEHAIQANLIMISRLLAKERKTLNSVRKHWGAGFEMIYYDGRQFKKIDDITYVINYGNYTDAGEVPQVPIPAIILNYKYHGELLVITVIRCFSGNTIVNDDSYTIVSDNILKRKFIVTPFEFSEDIDQSLGDNYSFTSNLNVMSYILEGQGHYFVPASFNIGRELEIEHLHPNTIKVTMLKPINDRLTAEAKKVLSNPN